MLRVIETFSGIGAQTKALKNIGIPHQVVGISEWNIDAIISYAYIHHTEYMMTTQVPDIEIMKEFLSGFTFSADSKTPISVDKINKKKLTELYKAQIITKNMGSIVDIKPNDVPYHDLLTYSFPCQAISTAGKQGGLEKGSGTTSSLLWEVERILLGLHAENRLPKYLLMENVPPLITDSKFIPYFHEWCKFLHSIGYDTAYKVIDSSEHGSAQVRKRAFAISIRKESTYGDPDWIGDISKFEFPLPSNTNITGMDILDCINDIDGKYFLNFTNDDILWNPLPSTSKLKILGRIKHYIKFAAECVVYCPKFCLPTITAMGASSRVKIIDPRTNKLRTLTACENLKLMGFTRGDYINLKSAHIDIKDVAISKQAGNSISVQVLEALFLQLFSKTRTVESLFSMDI